VKYFLINDLFKDQTPLPRPLHAEDFFLPRNANLQNSTRNEKWKESGSPDDSTFFRPYVTGEEYLLCFQVLLTTTTRPGDVV